MTYISIELANKTGEVVMFEILGKKLLCELGRIPHYKAVIPATPGDYCVGGGIIHHIIGLGEKRRGCSVLQAIHWLGRRERRRRQAIRSEHKSILSHTLFQGQPMSISLQYLRHHVQPPRRSHIFLTDATPRPKLLAICLPFSVSLTLADKSTH